MCPMKIERTNSDVSGMVDEHPASTILWLDVSTTSPIKSIVLLRNRIIHRSLRVADDVNRILVVYQTTTLLISILFNF